MKRIRTLMADDGTPLKGDVEVDETSWGGKPKRPHGQPRDIALGPSRRAAAAKAREAKPTILGMVSRAGERQPGLDHLTDDWASYKPLRREYIDHKVINHSAGIYVEGSTHTNTIEGFFGNLKTGMRGTYKKVSPAYLQSYLDEYSWRYNAKREPGALFTQLLLRAAEGRRPQA